MSAGGGAFARQAGFSIPAAIFVLVVVSMLGVAMVNILNQGQEAVAREVISIRALMAAESGAERGLQNVLVAGVACSGAPGTPAALTSINFGVVAGMQGCTANVLCEQVQVDIDNNGVQVPFYTLTSTGQCGSPSDPAVRTIQVQAW
jgi:MSHA biogenesis protein MshP